MANKIEISYKSILLTLFLLISLRFVSLVWDIFLMVFIAIIIMSAFAPIVDRLEKLRVPRALAIIIVYLLFWGIAGSLVFSMVPGIIDQTTRLIKLLPQSLNSITFVSDHQQEINQQLLNMISSLPQDLLRFTVGLFGNVLNFFTTLVLAFYLLLDRHQLHHMFSLLTGTPHHDRMEKFFTNLEKDLGGWVRGELILMFSVGLLTYIGLTILGIDIALPLAVLAGILEIVPNIGPVISAVPSILITLSIHPILALSTAALYFLVQFLENNLLVPNIMQRAAGVNPLISVVALMIGFRLAGPLGAILAIPLIIVIRNLIQEYYPPTGIKTFLS